MEHLKLVILRVSVSGGSFFIHYLYCGERFGMALFLFFMDMDMD